MGVSMSPRDWIAFTKGMTSVGALGLAILYFLETGPPFSTAAIRSRPIEKSGKSHDGGS